MSTRPLIKSVMTPFPYSVSLDAPLSVARSLMREHGIRHLAVKDDAGELVGVLTDRDLKLVLGPYVSSGANEKAVVRYAYIPGAYTVELNTPLDQVVATMAERRIGSALVTKQGRLAGIFTAVDACRLFADLLRADFPTGDGAA